MKELKWARSHLEKNKWILKITSSCYLFVGCSSSPCCQSSHNVLDSSQHSLKAHIGLRIETGKVTPWEKQMDRADYVKQLSVFVSLLFQIQFAPPNLKREIRRNLLRKFFSCKQQRQYLLQGSCLLELKYVWTKSLDTELKEHVEGNCAFKVGWFICKGEFHSFALGCCKELLD